MADPTDTAADRFDDWLNADRRAQPSDDLTAFADRVLRDAAMPGSTNPTRAQRDRIRQRVLCGAPMASNPSKARTPMTSGTISADSVLPAPRPIERRDRPSTTGFSILMTAALVAIIGLAAFGLVRNSIDFTLPGGGDDPTGNPGIALSPEATPATSESCDPNSGVSIFEGSAPDVDGLGPFVLLNDSGTLSLYCDDAIWELATGVRHATSIYWPGTILLITDDDRVQLLKVADGTTLTLESSQLLTIDGELATRDAFYGSGGITPWLVTPANDDRTDWRITDLRSLDSFLLSDELGGPLTQPHEPYFGDITSADVTVVSWLETPVYPDATPVAGAQQLSDHAALVLPGSIDDRRWIENYVWRQSETGQTFAQNFSVSPDGDLLAYTTLSDTYQPVIRIEHAADGTHVVDVPIDEINADTRFILAGVEPHLVYSNGESVHIAAFVKGAAREIADLPDPHIVSILPTANPDIVLLSDSNTSAMPVNVTTGDAPEFYQYVPPIVFQIYGGADLPTNIVRVGYASHGESDSVVSLVNPATGEVVMQSDPIDQHPLEIISYPTWLRDGGNIAIVQIGPDRAIIMDAHTQEIWEVQAPDDAPLWSFFASRDGRFIVASPPKTTTWRTTYDTSYIAPLQPDAEWVPVEGDSAAQGWQQWAQATPGS